MVQKAARKMITAGQAELGFEVSSSFSVKTISFVLTILKGKRTVFDVPQPIFNLGVFNENLF